MNRLILVLSAAIPMTLGLVACDPTTPTGTPDPVEPTEPIGECPGGDGFARVFDAQMAGDTLVASIAHSGCNEAEVVTPCWDGSFMESSPVQVDLDLSVGPAQACQAYFEYTRDIDLTGLREAYEDAYNTDSGTITINLDGASVQYTF